MIKKWMIWLPNLFIVLLTVLILGAIFIPIKQYFSDQEKKTHAVLLYKDPKMQRTLEWLLKHDKIPYGRSLKNTNKNLPNLILLGDARALNEEFMETIRHNVFVSEMLFASEKLTAFGAEKLQYLFNFSFSGYVGKYYEDLGDEQTIPLKILQQYKKTHGNHWDISGKGLLLTNGTNLIVLEKGKDYTGDLFLAKGSEKIPYSGNFEVLFSKDPTESDFVINGTPSGNEKLRMYGLPSRFPAIIKTKALLFSGYYFAGDFSNINATMPYYMKGVETYLSHRGIYERATNEEVFWKWYAKEFQTILDETLSFDKNHQKLLSETIAPATFMVKDKKIIKITKGGEVKEFFINGVNLGPALPGKTFTEFPTDEKTYGEWIKKIGDLNMNAIRVYTLLPPAFYKALYEYNEGRNAPIYLLQEIWPEENPAGLNYLDPSYNKLYETEIKSVIDAIHGNANIPIRKFRSFGAYSYDVSPYLIGYLVGRELEPEEVLSTDEKNKGYKFHGKYLYSEESATPTESWLAASCDFALGVEESSYKKKPLVAIVNWPTLDPIRHPSEGNVSGTNTLPFNDKAIVDINHIGTNAYALSGFFGAYHIYPNYPDFMNNDPLYNAYADSEGRFRYGGYLNEFMTYQKKYPAIVAEYGLSTSLTTAHFSPDGYHHGGLTEKQQALGLIRMNKAIRREGYSGAMIFEWIDEWAKKTWITENYMIPYLNHPMWHNLLDPEQNYGLTAVKGTTPVMKDLYESPSGEIRNVKGGQNTDYVQLSIETDSFDMQKNSMGIYIDTLTLPGETPASEFLLKIHGSSVILANPGYNWVKGHYHAVPVVDSQYEELIELTNPSGKTISGKTYPALRQNLSMLKQSTFPEESASVLSEGNRLTIRLPYALLGISDPSSGQVLSDTRNFIPNGHDQIQTVKTEKILFSINIDGKSSINVNLPFNKWKTPAYMTNEKQGLPLLKQYFSTMGN